MATTSGLIIHRLESKLVVEDELLQVQLDYSPEGMLEKAGDAVGVVSGRVHGDLQRFKEFIEARVPRRAPGEARFRARPTEAPRRASVATICGGRRCPAERAWPLCGIETDSPIHPMRRRRRNGESPGSVGHEDALLDDERPIS
jgi:hypothetical protein